MTKILTDTQMIIIRSVRKGAVSVLLASSLVGKYETGI